MLLNRPEMAKNRCQHCRRGFLYLGAFREVFLISFAVAIVLALLWQASLSFQTHLSAQHRGVDGDLTSIYGLYIDQDQGTLVALIWPANLKSYSLESGHCSPQRIPENFVSAVSSVTNSTTIMMAEWTEEFQLHHRVDIVRRGEILLSEEVIFEPPSTAGVFVSSDGSIAMLLASEGQIIGWNLTESEPLRWEFKLDKTSPRCQLSPDGRRLLIAPTQGNLFICDSRTGFERIEFSEFDGRCRSIDWSSDGKQLAVGDETGGLHVFETVGGKRIWHDRLDLEYAPALVFSNDGSRLAVGGFDCTIRVWDLTQPSKPPLKLTGQPGVVRCLAFTPSDEFLISGTLSGSIHEWSLAEGKSIRKLQ